MTSPELPARIKADIFSLFIQVYRHKMEDVVVENDSGLQPSSSSLTASCTDTVTTPDTDRERQRKSQSRIWVEWILVGVVITAVWILIVGLPLLLYHLPQVRPHPVILEFF